MIQSSRSQEKTMAEIQLRDVSLNYSTPLRDPVSRLFEVKKERIQEDMPVEVGAGVRALDHVNLIWFTAFKSFISAAGVGLIRVIVPWM